MTRHRGVYSKELGRLVWDDEPEFRPAQAREEHDGRVQVADDVDFASIQFHPADVKAAQAAGYVDRVTADGRPVFTSKRQVDRFLGFHNGTDPHGGNLSYERGEPKESNRAVRRRR